MQSKNCYKKLLALCAVVALSTVCGIQAVSAAHITQQNNYIYAKMGSGGSTGETGGLPISGRWSVGTIMGDPDPANNADDNLKLIQEVDGAPAGKYGYTTIRIDEQNLILGDSGSGGWNPAPQRGARLSDMWGSWRASASNVVVNFSMQLIRDQVRFEYVITNNDTQNAHTVGLRMAADAMVDIANTTAYPFVPGIGICSTEVDFRGTNVPAYFEMFDNPESPAVIARNYLRGQDATQPDRVAIGEWANIVANDWLYTPLENRAVGNHGWALWWNEMVLRPGQSHTIVTYFGMGTASSSWTPNAVCLAVTSPRVLGTDSSGNITPFWVSAYVYNLSDFIDFRGVNLNITLPEGLELAEGVDNAPTKIIDEIVPRGTEAEPVRWRVKPTGTVSGPVTFLVSVSGGSGSLGIRQTASRTVILPATMNKAVVPGWQMISTPFTFNDPRPEFALLPVDENTGQVLNSDLQALSWNSDSNNYSRVLTIQPGRAFWLKFDSSYVRQMTLKSPGSTINNAITLPPNETMTIELNSGWNQIGNPYSYPILWGRVKVLNSISTGAVSLQEAVNRNWLRSTLYWYNPGKGEYDYSSSPLTEMLPWQGYWIKAISPCQLIIPPAELIGLASTSGVASRMAGSLASLEAPILDIWKLDIKARAGDVIRGSATIGLDSRASDGYGAEDIERPPSIADYVNVDFVHSDWGQNSGRFIQDIRKPGGDRVWEMNVSTDHSNSDVVLTWPGINSVPKNYRLRLEDVETGIRKDMRTTSSYRYNSGDSPTRQFKIIAESVMGGRLLITGLNVNPSRSTGTATVSYSLSTDAIADVKIRSAAGSQVANLSNGRGATRGISSIVWNYRNEKGEPVPVGSYIVEVVATTPEGEVAKALTPFIVAR